MILFAYLERPIYTNLKNSYGHGNFLKLSKLMDMSEKARVKQDNTVDDKLALMKTEVTDR